MSSVVSETEAGANGSAPAGSSERGSANVGPGNAGPAGTAAVMALRDRVQALHAAVDAVRTSDGDGATPATAAEIRDAAARLAALLGSLAPVLDADAGVELRRCLDALADRGAALVEADGARVLGEEMLARVPRALVVGPVSDRLRHHQRDRARTAVDALESAVDDPAATSALADADRLVITPPLTEAARGTAAKVLARCAAAADDRLDEALAPVRDDPESPVTGEPWAAVRSAALALSGSCTAAAGEHGKKARRLAAVADDVVAAVDEVAVAVRLQHLLVDLADVAHRHREPGFTYGVLHTYATVREELGRSRLSDALDELGRDKLHAWLPGR